MNELPVSKIESPNWYMASNLQALKVLASMQCGRRRSRRRREKAVRVMISNLDDSVASVMYKGALVHRQAQLHKWPVVQSW